MYKEKRILGKLVDIVFGVASQREQLILFYLPSDIQGAFGELEVGVEIKFFS